ncbi:DNA topoisomerase-3 [Anaerobacterium chartisolvens]|uniref:DNA topoisomerase n=1 Tax=Anaerobacterium chartisolvens TaxID=1297424 RepID=A0A369AEZ4_9FIRM|nr:DNA topoisomerase III [Anaerobacterium chartisolvens]RCX07889.1 DNA topoisomerase-3 [Anaerobacterium chartisolvens]
MILVLAEKSSVAQDIARVMGCTQKGRGFFVGQQYIVTWAVGHLITLCEAKEYDPALKKWSLATLPIIPRQMQIKVIPETEKQFWVIKALMDDDKVDSIVCATDAGREGELIFRHIYSMAGCRKPFKRLWISSLTDEAIREGFSELRPGNDYDNIYYSALCRSYADWIVGINATRAYSIKYSGKEKRVTLTLGRVQTPTLALIVNKQKDIDAFRSKEYWEIQAVYDKGFSGHWMDRHTNEARLYDKSKAYEIAASVKGRIGFVRDIQEDETAEPPPLLYDLTELQCDANRRFGFSAQETLEIAQKLYESRKYITYPRTDSRYISEDMIPTLTERVERLNIEPYRSLAGKLLALPQLPVSKRVADNSKLSDHHAIIPTPVRPDMSRLSEDEEQIYDLIVRRFLCVFYPKYEYTTKTVTVEINAESFVSRGKTVNRWGWMECYIEALEEEDNSDDKAAKDAVGTQKLPELKKGEEITAVDVRATGKKTRPPPPYTEAALLYAMEHVGRYVSDREIKEKLKETKGLGTPATRSAIIEKLIGTGYIKRKNKYLIPCDKAMKLIDIAHDELKSPEMTGQWEKALSQVAEGSMTMDIFMNCIVDFTRQVIEEIRYSEGGDIFDCEDPGRRNYHRGEVP